MLNVHHLELFYYVARFGGISEAVRNIPYGIQQPAVSAQVIQLEDYLGVTLFQRRPFVLSASGEKLFEFIRPFFDNLERVAEELQGGAGQQIRIGSSQIVLRDHLPAVVQNVRKKFPRLKLVLREGYQPQLETWLQRQEIDLAITLLDAKGPPGLHSLPFLKIPLVLMVNKKSKITSAEELWKRDKIEEPLLSLPATEGFCKNFQQGLARMNIDWFPSIEVSSLELIQTYVESGYGIGLTVAIPKAKISDQIRVLPLEGFAPVTFGVLWQGKQKPLAELFIAELKKRAESVGGVSAAARP